MKKWTKEEDDFLINNYKTFSFEEIKRHFGTTRSDDSIRRRAKDLNLTDSKNKSWSDEEIEMISSDMSDYLISKKTNRTISAIRKKRAIEKAKVNENVGFSKYFDISAIENDVPIIKRTSKSGQYFALLNSLKVGQSFEYPTVEKELVRNQIYLLPNKKFQTKKWTEETRRCWRIEN